MTVSFAYLTLVLPVAGAAAAGGGVAPAGTPTQSGQANPWDILEEIKQVANQITSAPSRYPTPSAVTEAIDPLIQKLASRILNHPDREEIVHEIFTLANTFYLARKGNRTVNEGVAELLITGVHPGVSDNAMSTMDSNFAEASTIFGEMPYNRGLVGVDGYIRLESRLHRLREERERSGSPIGNSPRPPRTYLGLNCITMNNILSNLVVGASEYTPDTRGTNEDLFTKSEFHDMDVYGQPVLEKVPAGQLPGITPLLRMYGRYFAIQEYSMVDGQPVHTIFLVEREGRYYVWDTLGSKENLFVEVGELESRYPSHLLTFTFNLLDTESAQPIDRSKPGQFLNNLRATAQQARDEYREFRAQINESE